MAIEVEQAIKGSDFVAVLEEPFQGAIPTGRRQGKN